MSKDIDTYDGGVRIVFQSRMKSKEAPGSKANTTIRDVTRYLHGPNDTPAQYGRVEGVKESTKLMRWYLLCVV